MSRSTSLDFAQANEIAALKVAIAVFELPERRIWGTRVEDVAHYAPVSPELPWRSRGSKHTFVETIHVQLSHERGNIGVLEI